MRLTNHRPVTLLDTAIRSVGERTGLELIRIEPEPGPDLRVRLNHAPDATEYRVETTQYLNKQAVGRLTANLTRTQTPVMLVADYVNPRQAARLRRHNIPFIDTAGNAYINEPPVFVFVIGHKPAILPTARPRARLFQPNGLRLIFALLNRPGLERKPYRDLADMAGIALGGVAWIMGDLRDGGYLIAPTPTTRQLINKRALTDQWVANYPARLRERLVLGRYTAAHERWWHDADISEHRGCWGGEIAADRLTRYPKPKNTTVYADKLPARLMLDSRLQKAPDGHIEIMKRFWTFDYPEQALRVVPPLLVYADLMATGDGRNADAARTVYDNHVARHFDDD